MQRSTIAGKPVFQYWQERRQQAARKQKARKAEKSAKIGPYFEYWKKTCAPACEECGAPIPKWGDPVFLLACQAHIVPKEHFGSVAAELQNHLTLGASCGCHNKYDLSWHSARTMKVWPVALERFRTFAHLIQDRAEVRRLPEEMRALWEEIHAQS